ncbi:MAG: glycosyltransferase [Candidatus Hydrogenedentota bacterium]
MITFSTNISAGHQRAAEAVARAMMAGCSDAEIVERDSMSLIGPSRRRILTDAYLSIIRYKPSFWNYLYHNKEISSGINRLGKVFLARAFEAFEAEIELHEPDVVICTQAIPARIIAALRASGRCKPPVLAVATDYGIHPYWAHEGIDRYAVPCEMAAEELIRDGIPSDRIHVTGIPVDAIFEQPPTRQIARHTLGLPMEGRFVLVMGGGNGLGVTADHVASIERTPGVDAVIVIAGRNAALQRAVQKLPPCENKLRLVLSTVTDIERYYAASDVLVSKPGGLTMSEATAMGMPLVMISPLPGQEVRNAQFLSRAGAALQAMNPSELSHILSELLSDGAKLSALASASRRVGRSGASRQIASIALEMARGRSQLAQAIS